MKFYITKSALTRGIIEIHGETISSSLEIVKAIDSDIWDYIEKPFWHVRQEDAIEHAESMRDRKIKSLGKQIEKLEKLKFK